jgi:hypothetical protein
MLLWLIVKTQRRMLSGCILRETIAIVSIQWNILFFVVTHPIEESVNVINEDVIYKYGNIQKYHLS